MILPLCLSATRPGAERSVVVGDNTNNGEEAGDRV
jgi:hypothetical protein